MARIDWVVVPSIWWENGPLVILEAFQHGRPVICSDIGGMSEKVTDGVNGLHFRRGDPRDLARRDAARGRDARPVGRAARRHPARPAALDARPRRDPDRASTGGCSTSGPRDRRGRARGGGDVPDRGAASRRRPAARPRWLRRPERSVTSTPARPAIVEPEARDAGSTRLRIHVEPPRPAATARRDRGCCCRAGLRRRTSATAPSRSTTSGEPIELTADGARVDRGRPRDARAPRPRAARRSERATGCSTSWRRALRRRAARPERYELASRLFTLREALRERLPRAARSRRTSRHGVARRPPAGRRRALLLHRGLAARRGPEIGAPDRGLARGRAQPSCSTAPVPLPAPRRGASSSTLGPARLTRASSGFICFFELDAPSLHAGRLDARAARTSDGAASRVARRRRVIERRARGRETRS